VKGATIRAIMARRKEREGELYKVAKDIREQRLQKALQGVGGAQLDEELQPSEGWA
jgi:hypothetical protein